MNWFNILMAILELLFLDVVLSIDNAIMISSTTKDLNEKNKKLAQVIGASGAVLLRLIFIIIIMFTLSAMMSIPFIYILGGIVLIIMSTNMTKKKDSKIKKIDSNSSMWKAVAIIMAADIMLSFDNAFVISNIAIGLGLDKMIWEIVIVAIALIISLLIIIKFSEILGKLMKKNQWIVYVASWLLLSVGIEMMMQDFLWTWMILGVKPSFDINGAAPPIYFEEILTSWGMFAISYFLGGIIILSKIFYLKKKNN